MKPLLDGPGREVLARFARSSVLVALDFDGTLAPIVADRDAAGMRPRTRALLAGVCRRYPCAVISGRARADVAARLEGVEVRHIVGNHGLEAEEAAPELGRQVRQASEARRRLEEALGGSPGIEIEDKGLSLAVHYRRAPREDEAREAILGALALLGEAVRVTPGKLVFNVLPDGARHKGTAVEELRRRLGVERVIFVGDDVTDEDAFALEGAEWLLGVRVGESAESKATYFLRDQGEMDELLVELLRLRAEPAVPG